MLDEIMVFFLSLQHVTRDASDNRS